MKKPVIIESPFAGNVPLNRAYLQACIRDCLGRGETPYASHQMLTWALDDLKPEERELGISSGLEMRDFIRANGGKSVYYVDLGWSAGMTLAKGSLSNAEERVILAADEWPRVFHDAISFGGDPDQLLKALYAAMVARANPMDQAWTVGWVPILNAAVVHSRNGLVWIIKEANDVMTLPFDVPGFILDQVGDLLKAAEREAAGLDADQRRIWRVIS